MVSVYSDCTLREVRISNTGYKPNQLEVIGLRGSTARPEDASISSERRRVADEIPERVKYVELTTHAGFEKTFMKAMFFDG